MQRVKGKERLLFALKQLLTARAAHFSYVRMHLHHETGGGGGPPPRRRQRPKTSELPGGTKPTTISVTQAVQNNLRKCVEERTATCQLLCH